MFDRDQVERILTQHGIETTAPDEKIRAVLMGAQWQSQDIESALYALRGSGTAPARSHIESLQKIQRTDSRLEPESIKALLGIDVEIRPHAHQLPRRRRHPRHTTFRNQVISIMFLSILLGVGFVFYTMWVMQAGVFHPTFR